MTDRKPTAPGQYTMTVAASEAQKLLIGEAVTVTLVRDDHPEVPGTPYNKASVLPDELAAVICPSVTDPTPADAFRGLLAKRYSAVIPVGWWNAFGEAYECSIPVSGILDTDTPLIDVDLTGPEGEDYVQEDIYLQEEFGKIYRAITGAGAIVFRASELPDVDIPVKIEVHR